MVALYRAVMCGQCGRRNVLGNAAGMKPDGTVVTPIPFEDAFVMRCPCGTTDTYGVEVIETVEHERPLTDAEFFENVSRFSQV